MAIQCFMNIAKVKRMSALKGIYEHSFRLKMPQNADPKKEDKNVYIYPPKPYIDMIKDRIKEISSTGEKQRKIRKDAVLGYDILMALPKEYYYEMTPETQSKWEEGCTKWLHDTFDKAGDGKSNIIGIAFHNDESGPHAHALVIPIDDKCRLNARFYTGSAYTLINKQNSFTNTLNECGLNVKRGTRGSTAEHEDIKRFYARLNDAIYGVPIPEKKQEESWENYVERLKNGMKTERAAHLKELRDKDKKIKELEERTPSDSLIAKKYHKTTLENNDLRIYNKALQNQLDGMEHEFGSIQVMKENAHQMQLLKTGLKDKTFDNCNNSSIREFTDKGVYMIIQYEEEKLRKEKKIKEEQELEELKEDSIH
ncbi:MobV family relaxase [Butyrivibrio fibrisolvens]|uniref:MobV family relaxase n=1 Tax=Butyrivibrio fibrisolvens TaxID=831 RepID=UPI0003B345BF|nr:MobV family relaxase [Butyrivibrio fibrisolvens]